MIPFYGAAFSRIITPRNDAANSSLGRNLGGKGMRLRQFLASLVLLIATSKAHAACSNPNDFNSFVEDKLRIITNRYYPNRNNASYRPPQIRRLDASEMNVYGKDFRAAFENAPAFFRLQLCAFDAVFIDPNASLPGGWGFWPGDEFQDAGPGNAIGVSSGLWNEKLNFAQYETSIIEALKIKSFKWKGRPTYVSATTARGLGTPETAGFDITLLGVLAHEAGHVLWRDQDAFRNSGCYTTSWSEVARRVEDHGRFHEFGALARKSRAKKRRSFDEIYGEGEWASLLATVGPDEDFIETYKLIVLSMANRSLRSAIVEDPESGFRADIMQHYRTQGTGLNAKQVCFTSALNGSAS